MFSEQWQILSTGVDNKVNIFQLYIQIDYSTVNKERKKEISYFAMSPLKNSISLFRKSSILLISYIKIGPF